MEMGSLPPALPCVPCTCTETPQHGAKHPAHSVQHFRLDSQLVWSRDVPLAFPKCPCNPTVKVLFSYLSDILWTSFQTCRRHPCSASVVYTWQLCFSEGWLEPEVGQEVAQLEMLGLRRPLLTAGERQKAGGWCPPKAAQSLPYYRCRWNDSPKHLLEPGSAQHM